MTVTAYIALGANLGDPAGQLRAALALLAKQAQLELEAVSSFYASAPLGYAGQPDFVNAVARIRTTLDPQQLLALLLETESRLGRVRTFRNAPRTVDLDLLLYGDLQLRHATLELPHPRMQERAFVIVPLLEIAPEVVLPGLGPAWEFLPALAAQSLTKLAD